MFTFGQKKIQSLRYPVCMSESGWKVKKRNQRLIVTEDTHYMNTNKAAEMFFQSASWQIIQLWNNRVSMSNVQCNKATQVQKLFKIDNI